MLLPKGILVEHTKQTSLLIQDFAPQVVTIFNCMGRKLFWDTQENIEIAELSKHMHTAGFSALGEIMRYKGTTVLNNLSIVTVAMREGEKQEVNTVDTEQAATPANMPITARLAVFINTITEELMEKNRQLNDMLYKASHDALTGLLNRGAIERIIYEADNNDWYLIMFDIDDFKQINDTYGHNEGDNSLKIISHYISKQFCTNYNVQCGRWGGEEFIIFISGYSSSQVNTIAEKMNNQVNKLTDMKYPLTISVGVTKHNFDESVLETLNRVDELLYTAKNTGKNKVCTDI